MDSGFSSLAGVDSASWSSASIFSSSHNLSKPLKSRSTFNPSSNSSFDDVFAGNSKSFSIEPESVSSAISSCSICSVFSDSKGSLTSANSLFSSNAVSALISSDSTSCVTSKSSPLSKDASSATLSPKSSKPAKSSVASAV